MMKLRRLPPFTLLRRLAPRTLMGRSLLILTLPVVLVQVIAVYIFFDRHWNKMTTRLAYAVAGEVSVVVDAFEEVVDDEEEMDSLSGAAATHLGIYIEFRPQEELSKLGPLRLARIWDSLVARMLEDELDSALRYPFTLDVDIAEKWIEVAVQLDDGVLLMTFPERRLFSSSGYIFLFWMTGSSLILLVVAIAFMRNQVRPIRKLAVAAERFGKGRDVPNLRPSGASEIRQAAEAFIDMHRRIKRQVEQRTAMLAGISHDIRTPLTRMKLQLAVMEAQSAEGAPNPEIEAMKADIRDMERMIQGYLDFVRGDGDEVVQSVSLAGIAEKIAAGFRGQDFEVSVDIDADMVMQLRPMAFERCLSNLVSNAAHHAGIVWIRAFMEKERAIIEVDDNGPGIPEDRYEDVFKPFFRLDNSRNAETGGVGLGLPIAMDIVHAHGGSMALSKSPPGGLRVRISLPV